MIAGPALACLIAAASAYPGVPVAGLVAIQAVEAGRPGLEVRNTDGSVDLGFMQINSTWVPALARHWGVSNAQAHAALRDDLCVNAQMGAYVLHRCLEDARRRSWSFGEAFWEAVGCYNARSPDKRRAYARRVVAKAYELFGPRVFQVAP
jgi:soluble lytic murein transglycosylase-like protein